MSAMRRFRAPYPPEFRRQLVELVRSGRTPESLAREFEPSSEAETKGAGEMRFRGAKKAWTPSEACDIVITLDPYEER